MVAELNARMNKLEIKVNELLKRLASLQEEKDPERQIVDAVLLEWQKREAAAHGAANGAYPMTKAEAEQLYEEAEEREREKLVKNPLKEH